MYLSLGTKGRRVFNSKNLTINLEAISTKNLWDVLNTTFIRIHNITFDRYLFLTRKQQKGEPIEKFYGQLKELSENCDLGEKGDTIIRDVFIANMQNEDIQKELLKETVDPDRALAIAINIEMGTLNQLKMNANKADLHSTVNQVQRMRIANATPFSTMRTTARKSPQLVTFVDQVGLLNTVINVPLGERDAIIVVLKTISLRFVVNLKIPIRTQDLSHESIMSKKMTKLRMSIKFRQILTLIWSQTTHQMKIIV